jgi:hypothetical protein
MQTAGSQHGREGYFYHNLTLPMIHLEVGPPD